MLLYWYACISTNTYCYIVYYILLEMVGWALFNTSSIVRICSAVHEILADKAFIATDVLISQSFVVAFVPPTYMQIALIWGFPEQLSLWKLVHWLWRYKLNEVCDILSYPFKALSRLSSSEDYKRTWQGVLAALLLYLYKYKVVRVTTIFICPNVYASTSYHITHPP